MHNLIEEVGFVFFTVGIVATIFIGIASAWKAHYKKIELSRKSFIKYIYLIGIASVMSGIGFTLSVTVASLPQYSVFRTFIMSIFCIGVYPAIMVGIYIFDMKYYGYIESNHSKNKSHF